MPLHPNTRARRAQDLRRLPPWAQFVSILQEAGTPPRVILVVANRGDEEPWRLQRLRRVALATLRERLPIDVLEDHKGRLSARFTRKPDVNHVVRLHELWRAEGEGVVDAVLFDGVPVLTTVCRSDYPRFEF